MREYTKRDSCMTMEEVIERNTGMPLKAFLTPQPNPYIHNMDRAVYFFKKKVNDAAEKKEILQIKIVGDYDADGMNASAILYDAIISYLTSGVLALVRKMRLEKITAEDYGYKIGPVCNASGRLLDDGAMDIFHLLSQELDVFALDYDEQLLKLHSLADTVIERNVERRRITEEALERSDALISQQCKADDAVYIIYDTQVSEGVMGIVAGKLAEKYMRPVIVFANAQDGEKLKGSGRTYGNIHLKYQILDPCKEYFFTYGGHAGAAGITIPEKNLMLFRNKVRKLDIPVLYREKRILYDLEVTKEEIPDLYEKMEYYAPFGEGNPEPVFFIRNLELSPVRGKFYEQNGNDGRSIKLFTTPYPSSGYQMAAEYLLMDAPKKIDMTFEVYTIYSHGKEHRRLRMLDFCASKNAETETSFKKELSAMLNFM